MGCRLIVYCLCYIEAFPLVPRFSRTFNIRAYWSLSKPLKFCWVACILSVVESIYVVDYIEWFIYVKPFLHLWGGADVIVKGNLWYLIKFYWKIFANILLKIFISELFLTLYIRGIDQKLIFFTRSLSILNIRVVLAL